MSVQMVWSPQPEAGRRPRPETGRRRAIRNTRFGGEFLERKLSPSGGLAPPPPPAEVLVLSAKADAPVSSTVEDEPRDPEPTYPYPPINGEPPLFPPHIPGGPMGPG